MSDIYVFGPNDEENDYATMGLVGALTPIKAEFSETLNGDSSFEMEHPLDEFGRYFALKSGNILSVPVPVRTTPEIQNGKCVTTVWTYRIKPLNQLTSKAQRTLYKKASGNGKRKVMKAGDKLTVVSRPSSDSDARWKVKSKYGTGYVNPSGLVLETEHIIADNSQAIEEVQSPWTVMEQQFRIYRVKKGMTSVSVFARHISYDLLYSKTHYKSNAAVPLQTALDGILKSYDSSEFKAYTNVSNTQAGLDFDMMNPINAFLDPENGICAKYDVSLIRDNHDLYFLHDPGLNRGVRISYGKNLLGIDYDESEDEVATRIIPVGEKKNGEKLFLSDDESKRYVDSPLIDKYAIPHLYELKCENCKVGDKDSDGGTVTVGIALARMRQQAQDLISSGCDKPRLTVSVDFLNLGDTEEYKQFKNLENLYLADYALVDHSRLDIDVTAQIVRVKWDCILDRMIKMEIGQVGYTQANTGITTWQIPIGFSGSKIADQTIGSGALMSDIISTRHLQAGSINAEHIAAGVISTEALNAVTARIEELAAGNITADELYTALATIALAQITTANIDKANIDWAQIKNLNAQVAEISKAQITTANITSANIDWASIQNLSAAIANIAQAKIDNASITTAQISDLRAEIAKVITLSAQDGKFDFASIKDLLAQAMILEEGVADSVMIKNLIATKANFVGATMGELVLQGSDGLYYKIVVQSDGTIHTEQVTVTDGEIAAGQTSDGRQIVATTANVDALNASDIKAQSAIISSIFTSALTAGKITAQDAFLASATIPELRVTALKALGDSLDISANEQIRLIVGRTDDLAGDIADVNGKVDNIQIGGRNLIRDSSMELGNGWNDYSGVSATGGIDGGACFKVTGALKTAKYYAQLNAIRDSLASEGYFKPGEQYVVSYWARGEDFQYGTTNPAVGFDLEFYNAGKWVTGITFINQIPTGTSDWTRYSTVITIPTKTFDRVNPVYIFFRDYTGTVYIDRIQLETGNRATDWTPAPEDVDASIQAVANQAAVDMANIVTRIDSDIDSLQSQIDGSITTWFYPVPPTDGNLPAMDWTTTDLKNIHLGDLYYDTVTGYCYRWQVQNNAYSWQRITDTDVTKALSDASAAQDTADSKRRVFVSQPVPPYDQGDLWVQGSGGDILRCQTRKIAGQSYAASDWVKASKYTDDTTANSALTQVGTLQTTVTQQQTEINQTKEQISLRATKTEVTQAVNNIQVGGRNLLIGDQSTVGNWNAVLGTDGDWHTAVKMDGYTDYGIRFSFTTVQFTSGEQYTLSFDAKAERAGQLDYLYLMRVGGGTNVGLGGVLVSTAPQRVYLTFTASDEMASAAWYPMIATEQDLGKFWVKNVKVERGNKATDWTPAPEDVDASIQAVANQAAADMANIVTRIDSDIDSLQSQIDGSITTWFYPVPPTDGNLPAMDWTTTDLKNIHLGDLYYDTVTGYCYRWQVQNNAYSWQRITDTDVTKALSDASAAQDTADSKRRVFVSQPVPPYDQGDLWAQGSGGDILRCQTRKIAGQSYAAADWVKASKYTDDTKADSALTQLGTLQTTVTQQQTEINQTKEQISLRATKEEVTQAVNDIQVGGRNLLIGDQSTVENWKAVLGTDGDWHTAVKMDGYTDYGIRFSSTTVRFTSGEQYTLSFDAKAEQAGQMNYLYLMRIGGGTNVGLGGVLVSTTPQRVYLTFTANDEMASAAWCPMIATIQNLGKLWIKNVKIERGNKATDWTPAPEDVDASIEGIQIGGRNLLRGDQSTVGGWNAAVLGMDGEWHTAVKTDGYTSYGIRFSFTTVQFTSGEQYTLSFDAKAERAGQMNYLYLMRVGGGTNVLLSGVLVSTTPQRVYLTFTASDEMASAEWYPMIATEQDLGKLWIKNVKIERGNKATDWTPAPEDVMQRVDEQSARLDVLTDSVNARVEKAVYDQDLTGIREQVSAQYTDFTQTTDGMKAEIGTLQQDGDELRAYVRYGLESGIGTLSMGQINSAYKAVVNNTGFTIQQDGTDMTYIRKNTLSAPVVEARRVYQQGNYTVKVQADGGLMWN